MISSLKPSYIQLLNDYKKVLEQRNNYLKQIKELNKPEEMLDVWDEQLSDLSFKIYKYRNEYVDKLKEKIETIHKNITKSAKEEELIKIKYISTGDSKERYLENIKKARNTDINRGFSSIGIHRDDLIIYVNHKPVRTFWISRSTKDSNIIFKTS